LPLAALQPDTQAANVSDNVIATDQDKDEKKKQKEIEKHLREIEKHRREITEVHQREIEKHVRELEKLQGSALTDAQKARVEAELKRDAEMDASAQREMETRLRDLGAREVDEQKLLAEIERMKQRLSQESHLQVEAELAQVLKAEAERMKQLSSEDVQRLIQTEIETAMRGAQFSKSQAEMYEKRAELSAQLERLQRQYTNKHPSVIEQKERLDALSEQMAEMERAKAENRLSQGQVALELKLADLEAKLKTMRRSYTDKHPDVQSLRDQIEALKREIELMRK
jgi:chromosome segregation ATPase